MPATEKEVEEEIKIRIPAYSDPNPIYGEHHNSEYKALSNRVGAYLSDYASLFGALKHLNESMALEAAHRLKKNKPDQVFTFLKEKATKKRPEHLQNLLTTVLARTEELNGFRLYSTTRKWSKKGPQFAAITLLDVLSANEFNNILKEKMPFKDPGVADNHGAHTMVLPHEFLHHLKRSSNGAVG